MRQMKADVPLPTGVRTVYWEDNTVCLLDQSALPHQVIYLHLRHEEEVAAAIRSLKVRGAPVIGVTAAFGMALALTRFWHEHSNSGATPAEVRAHLATAADLLRRARPTAVNLPWAVARMLRRADEALGDESALPDLVSILQREAQAVADEDFAACLAMGRYGAELIPAQATLLTHCNAGALATAGLGSGLAPLYVAQQSGKQLHVFVDETRPVLQGARLTAWELQQAGIPLTLITDNMAAHFMRHGGIDAVFVGADRIAANGDTANKIGTYPLAIAAKHHGIPFYVAAPASTFDPATKTGEGILIEQRHADEVCATFGARTAPEGASVYNPAFDVTPARLITAIISDRGIHQPPYHFT